jgi:hypothetical protein
MVPLISSSITGGGEYFNPVTQFLPAFWQDLGLLGTGTQAMVINFFSMLAEAQSAKVQLGKDRAALLEEQRRKLTGLLEQEKRGRRQKLDAEKNSKREHGSVKSKRDLIIGVVAGAALGQGYSLTTQGGLLLAQTAQFRDLSHRNWHKLSSCSGCLKMLRNSMGGFHAFVTFGVATRSLSEQLPILFQDFHEGTDGLNGF